MSVQSVGPFSNFKTNFNTTKQAASNPQIAQDVAKDVSKNNKKTAAIIGGVAALAILGTGALVAIKRHNITSTIESIMGNFRATNETANALAQNVQKQADEAMEYAQKLFDEVTGLFKKGEEMAPDGTALRRITGDDTSKIMEEFSQDGTLLRRSEFINDILDNVEEGIEEFADGSRKIARRFGFFVDGTLTDYQEGIETFADESGKVAKNIIFKDGKPCLYQEGCETFADESGKVAKNVIFEDGKLSLYQEGIETFADKSGKVAKTIGFEEGKPSSYQEGCETFTDLSGKIARIIGFEEGGIPRQYAKGVEYHFDDGLRKIAKEFELTDKGWREVSK